MEIKYLVPNTVPIPHVIISIPDTSENLFYNLAYALYSKKYKNWKKFALHIRREVVNFIGQKWDIIKFFIRNRNGNMYKSREDYMLEMSKKNTYGTACEIRAAVRIYKCQVELYRSENAHPYEIYGNNPDLVIRLFSTVKLNGPHYDVCEPVYNKEFTGNLNKQILKKYIQIIKYIKEDTQQTDTDEDELEEGFNNLQKETKNTNSQANSNTLSFTIQSGNSENDDNCESLYEYEDNLSFVSMEVHPEENRRIENIAILNENTKELNTNLYYQQKKSNKSQSKFSNNIINLKVEDRYIPHIKINIPRDGSCLFHSISYGIYGEREYLNYTQIVRKEVVRYIAGKWDEYQNFTCNQFGDPYSTKQEYVQEMLKHGTYGSLFEAKIAALLYKRHIEVYLNEHNVQPFGEKTNPLTRIYFSGENILSGHFDVCEPLNCDTNSNDTENEKGLNETNQLRNSKLSQAEISKNIINLMVEDKYVPHTKIIMPGDGNCLFNALSYKLYGKTKYLEYTQIIRNNVVEYISDNWDEFNYATCNENGNPYATKEEYATAMSKSGTFGSIIEIKIAALFYHRRIEVYSTQNQVYQFGKNTDPLIRIYFSGENPLFGHFDVCEPLNCDSSLSNEDCTIETNEVDLEKNKGGRPKKTKRGRPNLSGKSWNELHVDADRRYRMKKPEVNRKAVSVYTNKTMDIKKKSMKHYRLKKFYGNTEKIISELTKIIGDRVEAEKIIKWTLVNRRNLIGHYLKTYENLKKNLVVGLEKYRYLPANSNTFTKFQSLLGQSLHRSTQEPYCAETSYKPLEHDKTIIINDGGKASLLYNFPQDSINIIEENKCCCNSNICLLTENKFKILKSRFMDMSNWCSKTILNFISENEESFDNNIVFFNSLKAHFPKMRTLVRQLYQMKANYKKIREIDSALDIVNEDKLLVFGNPENFQINKQVCLVDFDDITSDMNLPEDEIFKKYNNSFSDMTKKCLDTPKNECISCQKLFCLAQLRKLSALRKPIESNVWERLKQFIEEKKITSSNFICQLCLDYIRKNILPANCILNDLYVGEIPNELKKLNEYEKILIQRAKAFQMVTTMTPVSKRNIPNRHSIKKIIGRTFHLPLPLEATLQKLPKPEEPLNTNQDMYIIVRGCPTKKKIIWEDLVDVEKLYQALTFLKSNNKHYSKIILNQNVNKLLDPLDKNIQYGTENDKNNKMLNDGIDNSALLTQITDNNQHNYEYEHYTIYPLHERRKNSSITALYQMLKVNASTLDHCDKEIDVKCFPDLYYEGKFGQFHPREKKITSAEFIKSRLMSCHSQFRHNYQYIFYLLNDANLRQLSSGIYYNLNITKKNEKLTKETYLDLLQKDELEGDLSALFSRLRNTEQFWRKPRNDVVCMSKYYGPPTWFLTVSPSEWNWSDLEQYLRDINSPEMANKRISELIAKDPVSTCRFIDIKFRAFLDFLNSPEEPLGKIEHYFWRREYQSRGLQHFHILLWVKDAPVLEKSSTQEVADFISKYITCAIPNKTTSPTLYERVMNYQVHKHNSYCLRNKKRKHNQEIEEKTKPNKNKSDFFAICRFGFPRAVTDFIQINGVTEAVAARKTLSNKRLYNIQRKQESIYINDYNPVVMLAWNGNIDLQYIGEKTGLLNFYITKYTTKGEKSHIVDTFELLNSTKTLRSRLFNVGLRALSNRECGLLEASDTLLGISLYGTDPNTTIRWLDVNMNRNRRLKPKKQIEQLDPNSSDLFYESWVDDYYPNRPLELENIHLYDFLRWYDIKSNEPKLNENQHYYILLNNKFLIKRQRPYLINHYNIDINKYPENYYFSILLMFMPWRNLSQLKAGQKSYTEAFYLLKDKIKDGVIYGQQQKEYLDNWNKANEMIDAKISEIRNNINNDDHDDDNDIENPLEFQPVEAINAMDDFRRVVTISDDEMNKMIDNLNADQKRVFHKIQDTLNTENEILRFFVSGTGGTGKSYLINTIKHWVFKTFKKNVAVTAPTGIAAFNVNGLTIHRLLQLPVEHGSTPKYKPLSDQVLKVLRADLGNVMLIIIDEVSMISNITLMYIHLRLTEIFDSSMNENCWFGGKHILLFGDLLQLPPVRENSPFENISQKEIDKFLGSLTAFNLWRELFKYEELCINMRQQNDSNFMDMLGRIRLGVLTREDQELLSTRLLKFNSASIVDRLQELTVHYSLLSNKTVCLLPTKNMCTQLNEAMLKQIKEPEIELIAVDEIDCPKYFHKKVCAAIENYEDDSSMTAGLERKIIIKMGSRIMLRRNIDITLGLVNGSIGIIKQVYYDIHDKNKINKIKINFNHGIEYDLERVKTKFEILPRSFVYREQFPICLAYAITIHKSQGLSLDSALLDIGSCIFSCGQAYVALSRVKNFSGVHLINFDPSQIKAQESAIVEYNRLRSLYCDNLQTLTVNKIKSKKVQDRQWSLHPNIISADMIDITPIRKPPAKKKRNFPSNKNKTTKKKRKS